MENENKIIDFFTKKSISESDFHLLLVDVYICHRRLGGSYGGDSAQRSKSVDRQFAYVPFDIQADQSRQSMNLIFKYNFYAHDLKHKLTFEYFKKN